jgi:type II secretory pathway component GspD/PulD (secretin)
VISVIPTVGFGSVGFQPVIRTLPEGISLTVLAVISADRRYVRLSLSPLFSTITDVQTFSFASGGAGTGGGQTGGVNQGGQQGQQGGQFGFGGIGGVSGGQTGGQTGQQGQQGVQGQQGQQGGGGNITVQQPVFAFTQIQTTVSVPDGGTVLLGGVKRLKEGRVMAGVPILNKIPYISRLFKNTGVGREAESVMMMVTPRIIIQEEEEELLGVEL